MTDKEIFEFVRENYHKANKDYLMEQAKKAMEFEQNPKKLKQAIKDDITKRLMMGEGYFK